MSETVDPRWSIGKGGQKWMRVDLRGRKAAGNMIIHWRDDHARSYDVETSCNGINWDVAHTAVEQRGGLHAIPLKDSQARFLRLLLQQSADESRYSVCSIEMTSVQEELTPTRLYEQAAARYPGCYPRWLSNEQAYWTIVGTPTDVREGAFCEDGTIEPHKRGFTIQPILKIGDRLVTRNEAKVIPSLEKGCLPIPSVVWIHDHLSMTVQLMAYGSDYSSVYARYTILNTGTRWLVGTLYLVVHPIQVYPPWQGQTDGFGPIRDIAYDKGIAQLDGGRSVHFLTVPKVFSVKSGTFRIGGPIEGDIADNVVNGNLPGCVHTNDPDGFASAVAAFPFSIEPDTMKDTYLAVPLHEGHPPILTPGMQNAELSARYREMAEETKNFWEAQVNRVDIRIPDDDLVNTLKANIAYNLITKDGPAFEPGSRSYDKAWMRDGSMAAIALLKMGFTDEIRDFIEWYIPWQQESGEVPPIIDNKHPDPLWEEKAGLREYDSQGQYVHLMWEYWQYSGDRAFIEGKFDSIIKAVKFLADLRAQRATPEFRDDEAKRIFYNILPDSRSHEGYWLAHSYWDDIWALVGWKDAASIARKLGRSDVIPWLEAEYEALRKGVYDSMALVMERNHIGYLPGCAEKADFDPTATAAAIIYCDELKNLPAGPLRHTFDLYYQDIEARMQEGAEYAFTPYEVRNILAYSMMGDKRRSLGLLRFMLGCRRPSAWNHLAEVVHSDLRFPCYIGDMPHTWVGAELINSIRGLFVQEQEESLVLGAGVDEAWLKEGSPLAIGEWPTRYGSISYNMSVLGNTVMVRVSGDACPPKGFVLKFPREARPTHVTCMSRPIGLLSSDELAFPTLPVDITITY